MTTTPSVVTPAAPATSSAKPTPSGIMIGISASGGYFLPLTLAISIPTCSILDDAVISRTFIYPES